MGKRFSPTAIGGFVVGGFVVLLAAIVVVGGSKLFQHPVEFICMFPGNVNGLRVGAPVKFRGVQIGSVASIQLRLPPSEGTEKPNSEFRIPVIIEIDRSLLTRSGGNGAALQTAGFEQLIDQGLRAQLTIDSLLTGLLYVDLDIHPSAPATLALEPGGPLREIPTVPTKLEAIQAEATKVIAKLDEIDLPGLAKSISSAADSIHDVAASPQLKSTLASLNRTSDEMRATLVEVRTKIDQADPRLAQLVASLNRTSEETAVTLRQTRDMLLAMQNNFDPDAPVWVNLNTTLDQLTRSSRSLGNLASYLERNPSALVRGRYVSSGSDSTH